MATTINTTISELQFFLNHHALPAETRLKITFEDEVAFLEIQKHQKAIAAMQALKGSGNGQLLSTLLIERAKEKRV